MSKCFIPWHSITYHRGYCSNVRGGGWFPQTCLTPHIFWSTIIRIYCRFSSSRSSCLLFLSIAWNIYNHRVELWQKTCHIVTFSFYIFFVFVDFDSRHTAQAHMKYQVLTTYHVRTTYHVPRTTYHYVSDSTTSVFDLRHDAFDDFVLLYRSTTSFLGFTYKRRDRRFRLRK